MNITDHGTDGSKRYQYFRKLPNGETIRASKVFTKEQIKNREPRAWEDALDKRGAPDSKASLHSLFTKYLNEVSKYKRGKRSFKKESDYFARITAKDTGFFRVDRAISAVSEKDIETYVRQRVTEVKASTARRDFNTLRDFFRQCASKKVGDKGCWKLIERNPCDNISLPKPERVKGIYVTQKMREEYHAAAKSDAEKAFLDVYDFAIETGMRRGEIANLRAMHITPKIVTLFDGETKNGKMRDIPLTPRAREILKKYPDGFGLTEDNITRTHTRIVKRTGKTYTFHHLRHTAATDHGNSGKFSAFELMDWFGWADIETARIYVKTHIEAMADRFAPVPPRPAPQPLRLVA